MDKNTVTGLLLMVAVFFVFTWLTKPNPDQRTATQQLGQQTTATADATATDLKTDSIRPDEIAAVKEYVATCKGGELNTANLSLVLEQVNDSTDRLSGTVCNIDVQELLSGTAEGLTPEQRHAAIDTFKQIALHFNKYKSFAPMFNGTEQKVEVGNDSTNMHLVFNTKGAKVEAVTLNRYRNERGGNDSTKVELFNGNTGHYSLSFTTGAQRINTDDLYFSLVSANDTSVVMALDLAAGVTMQVRYTVDQESYLVKMDIDQKGMDAVIPSSTTSMEYKWRQDMMRNEVGTTFEDRYSCIYYKCIGDSPDDLNANKDVSETVSGDIKWVAFKNQFFSSVVIPDGKFSNVSLVSAKCSDKSDFVKKMDMVGRVPYTSKDGQVFGCTFFFGPNDYPLLSKLDDKISPDGEDLDLNRLVPLGWGIFGWINKIIVIPVFSFLSSFISNYGIIILLLTIFIKLILFPFTYKSYLSQAKMRLLAPQIKDINDKYPNKEDAMKRQQETMALYSRAGASPFSGCLPMLLQMPVLIAMFSFFPSAIELRGQSFLWVHDLSAPDYICKLPFSIPFYGDHVSLFCLLMTVTNIVYTRITMQNQPTNASMPSMKWMMYLMPVMFLFFFNDYAAALSYYYFLSLLITIAQTYVIRHFIIDEEKVKAEMAENAKHPKEKKGCMGRFAEAQKKQEAYMREQARQNARRNRR